MGSNSTASGNSSTAVGNGSTASGVNSLAIGTGNTVTGDGSGAIGDPSVINGDGSYSLGNDNYIDGDGTFVVGSNAGTSAAPTIANGAVILGSNVTTVTRSDEHTSELLSLLRISSALFCLINKK